MKHFMHLNAQPFAMIKSGEKTIELRLYDEKRKEICVGDEIEFVHSSDEQKRIKCTVVNMYVFDTFKQLYAHLPLSKCGYSKENIATASPDDMERYYSMEEQKRFGVVGIEVKLL